MSKVDFNFWPCLNCLQTECFQVLRASANEKKHTTESLSTTPLLLKEGQKRQLSWHCKMQNPTIYQFPDPTVSSLKTSVLALTSG